MKKLITIIFSIFLIASCNHHKGQFNVTKIDGVKNVMAKGFDVVSYFNEGKPVKGNSEFFGSHQGVKYLFSSKENLEVFNKNPEKYVPEYGGYCAFGVAVPNKKIDIDPNAWRVENGKLYLNYSQPTQAIWLKNLDENIVQGNENWQELKNQ